LKDRPEVPVLHALEPVKYLCSSGGKRLRPILLLLSCQTLGGDPQKALDAAAAMEMIHAASLIFDDLIDQDLMRRRRGAVHVKFGEGRAIAVGLFLASKSAEIMASYQDERVDMRFAKALAQLSKGELMGTMIECRTDVKTYLEIAKLKTSSLFMAAASIGALLGGGTEVQADIMSEYGKFVGVAFQIRDDVIDMQSNDRKLEQGLVGESRSDHMDEVASSDESSQARTVAHQLELPFSVKSALQISRLYAQKAISKLKRLNVPAEHSWLLEDFANYACNRNL